MNIVDTILKLIGAGNTTSAISSILGLNQDQTKRATAAAVPTLLAGLTHLSSTPHGAEQLHNAVSQQDTGFLDNLSDHVTGQGASLAERGSGLLSSLLGGGTISKLSGVLSRFTGVGEGATGKLMGLLTPAVLGVLGRQTRSQGLNAGGLANFLAGQKDNIRGALPAGLGSMLSSVLPGASHLFETARPAARTPEEAGRRPAGAHVPPRKSSVLQWAIPLLLILGALALFWAWSNRHRAAREAPMAPTAAAPTAPAEREMRGAPATGVASQASQLITQATNVFNGIGDAASAQAAAPTLDDINNRLADLRPAWDRLSGTARTSAQETLRPQVDRLKQLAQSALDKPGVADAVRPQIERIITSVDTMAAA
jgi:hypothetical protein